MIKFVKIWHNLSKYDEICQNMTKFVKTPALFSTLYIKIYQNKSKKNQNMSKFVIILQNLSKYDKIYQNT